LTTADADAAVLISISRLLLQLLLLLTPLLKPVRNCSAPFIPHVAGQVSDWSLHSG